MEQGAHLSHRVSTDGKESHVTEVQQAGFADDNIETDPHEDVEPDLVE
ncbi:hypothetical protein GALL_524570 [mine drainage metagenome]|uniref:Uncharacterized protein n=1 Tax=mine drainage metagenome TaxID=410659 RepID=A0A1J5PL12_9ZZZZ